MSKRDSGASAGAAGGLGLGAVLACILSWTVNKSILWCIVHTFCGWFYVIYWALMY